MIAGKIYGFQSAFAEADALYAVPGIPFGGFALLFRSLAANERRKIKDICGI